jgi:hypothetical protein
MYVVLNEWYSLSKKNTHPVLAKNSGFSKKSRHYIQQIVFKMQLTSRQTNYHFYKELACILVSW